MMATVRYTRAVHGMSGGFAFSLEELLRGHQLACLVGSHGLTPGLLQRLLLEGVHPSLPKPGRPALIQPRTELLEQVGLLPEQQGACTGAQAA